MDGEAQQREWKVRGRLNGGCECPAWHGSSVLQQLATLVLILSEFWGASESQTLNSPASGVDFYPRVMGFPPPCSLSRIESPGTHAFRVDWAAPRPHVTRWSDPVYMQTYSLTPPFLRPSSPFCWHRIAGPTHQSDGASPSLPSVELVIFMSPARLGIHLSLIDSWCCSGQGGGRFFYLEIHHSPETWHSTHKALLSYYGLFKLI